MKKRQLNSLGKKISDIQKIALEGIVSSKGITFAELVKEAFTAHGIVKEPFPSRDNLTYDEAVLVIKYGNDKFRKRKIMIKKCRECGKEVGISAKSCPHCGAITPATGNFVFGIRMLLKAGMLICCLYFLWVLFVLL